MVVRTISDLAYPIIFYVKRSHIIDVPGSESSAPAEKESAYGGTGISFVGYTEVKGGRPSLWNLQNLCPVPLYVRVLFNHFTMTYYRIMVVEWVSHSLLRLFRFTDTSSEPAFRPVLSFVGRHYLRIHLIASESLNPFVDIGGIQPRG